MYDKYFLWAVFREGCQQNDWEWITFKVSSLISLLWYPSVFVRLYRVSFEVSRKKKLPATGSKFVWLVTNKSINKFEHISISNNHTWLPKSATLFCACTVFSSHASLTRTQKMRHKTNDCLICLFTFHCSFSFHAHRSETASDLITNQWLRTKGRLQFKILFQNLIKSFHVSLNKNLLTQQDVGILVFRTDLTYSLTTFVWISFRSVNLGLCKIGAWKCSLGYRNRLFPHMILCRRMRTSCLYDTVFCAGRTAFSSRWQYLHCAVTWMEVKTCWESFELLNVALSESWRLQVTEFSLCIIQLHSHRKPSYENCPYREM